MRNCVETDNVPIARDQISRSLDGVINSCRVFPTGKPVTPGTPASPAGRGQRKESPCYTLQAAYLVEMAVARGQCHLMLPTKGRNPDVVDRDRCAVTGGETAPLKISTTASTQRSGSGRGSRWDREKSMAIDCAASRKVATRRRFVRGRRLMNWVHFERPLRGVALDGVAGIALRMKRCRCSVQRQRKSFTALIERRR